MPRPTLKVLFILHPSHTDTPGVTCSQGSRLKAQANMADQLSVTDCRTSHPYFGQASRQVCFIHVYQCCGAIDTRSSLMIEVWSSLAACLEQNLPIYL
jgi:hypothetical protein